MDEANYCVAADHYSVCFGVESDGDDLECETGTLRLFKEGLL